ncbi:hypothetical protein JCM10296v2_001008 [Rhodotorula toruloides]
MCDFLDCFIIPPAPSGSGHWAAPLPKPTEFPPPLDARESQAASEGLLAVLYDPNLAKSMSKIGRAALHCESDPAILWNALALLHSHTRHELDVAVGGVNLNLLGATVVDAKLSRTADAMRRLTHALTGDYGFIELAPNPLARSREPLTHCEIRAKGIVRGAIEERTKGVLDTLVREMKRLTEGGKRTILLSDLGGSSQSGAQSLLGKVLESTSGIPGIATIFWTDWDSFVPAPSHNMNRLTKPPYFLVIGGVRRLIVIQDLWGNRALHGILGELGLAPVAGPALSGAAGGAGSGSGGGAGGSGDWAGVSPYQGPPGAGGAGGVSDGGGSFGTAFRLQQASSADLLAAFSHALDAAGDAGKGASDFCYTSSSSATEDVRESAYALDGGALTEQWTKNYTPLRLQDVRTLNVVPVARSFVKEAVLLSGSLYRLPRSAEEPTPPLSPSTSITPTASPSSTARTDASTDTSVTAPRLLVFPAEPFASGTMASVHELKYDPDVVMKISVSKDELPAAEHEGRLYERFGERLRGVLVDFFGMFVGRPLRTEAIVLFLSWHGKPLEDWNSLSIAQRKQLYNHFRRLHQVGLIHNDVSPNNILVHPETGDFRLIDLAQAAEHTCGGPQTCPELKELSWLVYNL